VRAAHLILSCYGFWLPNDPRGSWSEFVRKWELVKFGKATKVETHASVAGVKHGASARAAAKELLAYPPVQLTGRQALAVGHGFDRARQEGNYVVLACAILPGHSHLVIGATERAMSRVAGHFKGRATQAMVAEGLWTVDGPPLWGRGCWKVYLDSEDDVRRAIEYVEGNPEKEGKRRQAWSFVVAFEGGGWDARCHDVRGKPRR